MGDENRLMIIVKYIPVLRTRNSNPFHGFYRCRHFKRPQPNNSIYSGFPLYYFRTWPLEKNSTFYTTLTGMSVLILWQFVPAVRILPHVIYMEWLVCVGVFLLMPLLDKRPIHRISLLNPGDSIS
ncbi:hypothetical protein SAMN02745975_00899 [Geosporobacter subterraneus DSM 17957]|uniref:Uncharacterized protein n=1 Tax=Geosporobacter subterraneus DSM 17957 TaxID=1121919 RepID=A0A1M6F3R9_9FIRM|nr:hypothetical protein SAMN02745975_00899 [Geosporobacter subterraneus DSM 17957]